MRNPYQGLAIVMAEDWRKDASCARRGNDGVNIHNPDDWYAKPDFDGDKGKRDNARRICGDCPVAQECFESALNRGERDGIWGGVFFTPASRDRRIKARAKFVAKVAKAKAAQETKAEAYKAWLEIVDGAA